MRLKAIIFDVDGTLAETEEAHRCAFNGAFAAAGLDWYWSQDDYRALLTTTGGRERIARFMTEQALAPDAGQIAALHVDKNQRYATLVESGAVTARRGVIRLIDDARRRGVALAIASTTSRENIRALLDALFGVDSIGWFAAIVAGEDVRAKKPDPEAYVRALASLGLDPGSCVAIEDSRNGLLAAIGAGLTTVVTPSHYSAHEEFGEASLVVADLSGDYVVVDLERLDQLLDRAPVVPGDGA